MMLAIRSGVTLAVLVLLALAGGLGRPATAGAPAVGITYEDGGLSITATVDGTGLLRVGGVHFDPAKPIGPKIVIGGSRFFTEYRVSSVSETELRGTVIRIVCVALPCVFSEPESFLLSGPVATRPFPSDMLFVGPVAAGGSITVAMNSRGITAYILEGARVGCTEPDNPLDIHAFAISPEDTLVFVERGVTNYVELYLSQVERPDDRTLTGTINFCGEFPWTAELVSPPAGTPPPATVALPPPSTAVGPTSAPISPGMLAPTSTPAAAATPAATSTVLASQLPAAGATTDGASSTLPAVFAVAGALLLGGGLLAARRRA